MNETNKDPYFSRIRYTGTELKILTANRWDLDIVTVDGRVIKRFNGIGKASLRVRLSSGVYFVIFNTCHFEKIFKILAIR